MTTAAFIRKWLANPEKHYDEHCRNEMLDDLYSVIEQAHTKQKLNIHGVMQAEGSEGADGAAVGQRSVGTNAEARDCETCKHLESENPYPCGKCDENYSMWEAPSGGHL
jgi:hypothetical protein